MRTKHLVTISLLLPLLALSATARAGSTISDKSYWPSETRPSAQATTIGSPIDANASLAYDRAAYSTQPVVGPSEVGSGWHYQGGPKSHQ
jgi:hypothetical protein